MGPTAVVTLELMWTPLRPFRAGPKRGTGCLSARCSGWIGMLGFFHVSNVILALTGRTVFTASGTSAVATSRKTDFPVASTRGGSCPPTRALRTMLDFGQSGHEAAVLGTRSATRRMSMSRSGPGADFRPLSQVGDTGSSPWALGPSRLDRTNR
jgi:hypothetical protein